MERLESKIKQVAMDIKDQVSKQQIESAGNIDRLRFIEEYMNLTFCWKDEVYSRSDPKLRKEIEWT